MADESIHASLPKTRREAKAKGLPRYFTGRPCKSGHLAPRSTFTKVCVECMRVYNARCCRTDYHREYQRKYLADPDNRARRREHDRRNKKKPEAKARRRQYRELLRVAVAGRPKPDCCDVCSGKGRISFDHCHTTGRFRGWLCERCNLVLGMVKDDARLLRHLSAYLGPT